MKTITLQINNTDALKTLRTLERKHFISIIDDADFDSPALPGVPMSITGFKNWVHQAEQSPTISLNEVKEKWANQRKQLQKLMK